jgi:dTDP-4-amino-4,6-dideoxygalactose transaminase
MSFSAVKEFEDRVASFYGAKYGIAVDSCTHGVELCLRQQRIEKLITPSRTYLSIPFLANKLNTPLEWTDEKWEDYYYLGGTNIIDGAVYWKEGGYKDGTFLCLSFQFQKHLSLGRGGMILTNDKESAFVLKKMSYDGRIPDKPWREQNIDTVGYHYYMTPETAQLGLDKLEEAKKTKPKKWKLEDWPNLKEMEIFKNG